jgi:hypothetical protein
LEELLMAVRHGNRADIDHIINVIRSGASEKKIRSVVARSPGLKLTVPDNRELDGVSREQAPHLDDTVSMSTGPSPGLKKPDGVPVQLSPDSWLSAMLDKDPRCGNQL